MKMVVYKYPFGGDEALVPRDSEVLHCAVQDNAYYAWCRVPLHEQTDTRRVKLVGTGNVAELDPAHWEFVNTVLVQGGTFVIHSFAEIVSSL